MTVGVFYHPGRRSDVCTEYLRQLCLNTHDFVGNALNTFMLITDMMICLIKTES